MLLSSHRKHRAQLVFEQQPNLVGRIFHPRQIHGCCPVRATGGSQLRGRYLLASLTGNREGSLMELRVKPTPTRFPTNSLYTSMSNTPLHSMSSVCHPWGSMLLCKRWLQAKMFYCVSKLTLLHFPNLCFSHLIKTCWGIRVVRQMFFWQNDSFQWFGFCCCCCC